MIAAAFLLLAAADVPPPAPPQRLGAVHGRVTAADRTKPFLDLICEVTDREKAWHALELKVSGGRGYERSGDSFETPQVMAVMRDDGKILGNLPFLLMDDNGARFGTAPRPQLFLEPAGKWRTAGYRQIVIHGTEDERALVGFCDVIETPQLPLSADEVEKLPL